MISVVTLCDKELHPTSSATYSVDAKRALIAFVRQYAYDDYNTWDYPEELDGIFESVKYPSKTYYYNLPNGEIVQSYERKF